MRYELRAPPSGRNSIRVYGTSPAECVEQYRRRGGARWYLAAWELRVEGDANAIASGVILPTPEKANDWMRRE